MSRLARKKPAPNEPGKARAGKKRKAAKDRARDSEDIERAVYDGMQDLRAGKPPRR